MNAKQILTEAGLSESHWGVKIIQAEESGGFINSDELSTNEWNSYSDSFINHYVKCLKKFMRWNRFVKAAETLIAIENRAAILLADRLSE